jgi:hypothetical protein
MYDNCEKIMKCKGEGISEILYLNRAKVCCLARIRRRQSAHSKVKQYKPSPEKYLLDHLRDLNF